MAHIGNAVAAPYQAAEQLGLVGTGWYLWPLDLTEDLAKMQQFSQLGIAERFFNLAE